MASTLHENKVVDTKPSSGEHTSKQPLFRNIDIDASSVDELRTTEIESLCMECEEQVCFITRCFDPVSIE